MTGPSTVPGQPRIGGARGAGLTLADQVVSSASNFVLGVLVARAGGADALGSFGIAFLIWLTVLGANRALVTEPMTVGGSTEREDAQLREGMLASVVLGVGAAGLLATVATALLLAGIDAVVLLALAPWIPSLLAHDYWRGMAYRLQRPDHALTSDAVFAAVQGCITFALFALEVASVPAFLAAWGIGATAGAATGLCLARVRMTCRGGLAHLRTLWPRSRWFLAEFGTMFPSDQGYLLLLPLLLGTVQFGAYRAGTSLIGPALVIFVAAGNVGLPECVRRLRYHGVSGLAAYTPRLTGAVLALTILYCGTVALLAEPLLRLTYGEGFTDGVVVTQLVAAQFAITAVGFGYGVALKAAGQMRQLWAVRAATAVVAIGGVIVLAPALGLVGAGLVGVLAGVTYTVGVMAGYRRSHRRGFSIPSGGGLHHAATAPQVQGAEGRRTEIEQRRGQHDVAQASRGYAPSRALPDGKTGALSVPLLR